MIDVCVMSRLVVLFLLSCCLPVSHTFGSSSPPHLSFSAFLFSSSSSSRPTSAFTPPSFPLSTSVPFPSQSPLPTLSQQGADMAPFSPTAWWYRQHPLSKRATNNRLDPRTRTGACGIRTQQAGVQRPRWGMSPIISFFLLPPWHAGEHTTRALPEQGKVGGTARPASSRKMT